MVGKGWRCWVVAIRVVSRQHMPKWAKRKNSGWISLVSRCYNALWFPAFFSDSALCYYLTAQNITCWEKMINKLKTPMLSWQYIPIHLSFMSQVITEAKLKIFSSQIQKWIWGLVIWHPALFQCFIQTSH